MLLIHRLSLRLLSFYFLWLLSSTLTKAQVHHVKNGISTTFADMNRTATRIIEYMNLNANPCEDFFEFACGKWIENRSTMGGIDISRDMLVTPQNELELGILKDLEAVLSDTQARQQMAAENKVFLFYQKCNGALSNSPEQENFMNTLRDQYGPKHNYDWLLKLATLRKRFGLNILIQFDVDMNAETFSGNSIYIGEPTRSTIIPADYCNAATTETMDRNDEMFQQIIEAISRDLQKWMKMHENEAKQYAQNIIHFEFELCKKMRLDELLSGEEEGNEEVPTELNEVIEANTRRRGGNPTILSKIGQSRLNGRDKGNAVYLNQLSRFDIDLRRYVTQIVPLQHNERIFLRNKAYLTHLANQIKITNTGIVANYIMYHIYAEFNFPRTDDTQHHQDHCARLVKKFFPKIAGFLYQHRYGQRQGYHNELESHFDDIKKAFETSLNADWIEENTKRAARQKLAQFKARFPLYNNLGFNDLELVGRQVFWSNLQTIMEYNARKDLGRLSNVDPDERLSTIEAYDVDARLMPMDNEILVGWALLREPFYEAYYPKAMKYATLGHRIARELVLAFDEEGWRPSPQSQRQWDALTEEGFRNRSDCFREQFSNYLYNNPDEFQNSTKLRQIIADSSGLNLAFNAYLSWLENMPADRRVLSRETLSGVNFTNTQLFFIHFAQTRCAAKPGEPAPLEFLPLMKHTPQRYDVNGPLSNFIEFAREFGCTAGDEMHPVDKCVIY